MSTSRSTVPAAASRGMKLIAVTGGCGKTTTTWLTAAVLAEAGLRVGVASDLGCVDAAGTLSGPLGRGRPERLASWIVQLAAGGCTHAVVELSADMLEAGAVCRGACTAVVVTGPVGTAHARQAVGALASGGCLVAPNGRRFAGLLAAASRRGDVACLTAGLDAACDVTARPVERSLHGQTFLASAAGQVVPVAVDAPVASFVRDALCAAAVGLCNRIPLDLAARGIEAAGSVAGRVERLDRGQDFAAFLDAPPHRGALASTLASLRRLTAGRLAVIAEERLVDRLGRAAFAAPVRRRCDDVVVVPAAVLDDDADAGAVAAYARVDRLLGRLGGDDCLLVLGDPVATSGARRDAAVPAATLVDGWLRLAHPPRRLGAGAPRAA